MKISDKVALVIVTAYSVFHVLILFGILPQNIVWGGKIIAPGTILVLELLALFIMLFLVFLILLKNKVIHVKWKETTINIWLMLFSIYFMLNTLANLMAETIFEKTQALLTVILAISLFKILKRDI